MNPIARAKTFIWMLAVAAAAVALAIVNSPASLPALTAEQASALHSAAIDALREVANNQPAIPARRALRDALLSIAESAPTADGRTLAVLARRGRVALTALERATPTGRREMAPIAALFDRIDTLIAVPSTPRS